MKPFRIVVEDYQYFLNGYQTTEDKILGIYKFIKGIDNNFMDKGLVVHSIESNNLKGLPILEISQPTQMSCWPLLDNYSFQIKMYQRFLERNIDILSIFQECMDTYDVANTFLIKKFRSNYIYAIMEKVIKVPSPPVLANMIDNILCGSGIETIQTQNEVWFLSTELITTLKNTNALFGKLEIVYRKRSKEENPYFRIFLDKVEDKNIDVKKHGWLKNEIKFKVSPISETIGLFSERSFDCGRLGLHEPEEQKRIYGILFAIFSYYKKNKSPFTMFFEFEQNDSRIITYQAAFSNVEHKQQWEREFDALYQHGLECYLHDSIPFEPKKVINQVLFSLKINNELPIKAKSKKPVKI